MATYITWTNSLRTSAISGISQFSDTWLVNYNDSRFAIFIIQKTRMNSLGKKYFEEKISY